jgi:hypothetical protein
MEAAAAGHSLVVLMGNENGDGMHVGMCFAGAQSAARLERTLS